MKSSKDIAKEIRGLYKANGIKASVRSDVNSIKVEVKEGSVKKANELASQFECIHRCEVTHEILSGGNFYVTVGPCQEMQDALKKEILAKLEEHSETLKNHCYAKFNLRGKELQFQPQKGVCFLYIESADKTSWRWLGRSDYFNLEQAINQAVWVVLRES